MENLTKALLIAAAVFFSIMLLSLVYVFWNDMSSYFTTKHDEKMLQQLIEFNDKFQNYNGKTIRGNELVSIMNSVVDYNNYQADMEGYERITLKIDFQGHQGELKYGGESGGQILVDDTVIKNDTNDDKIKNIATTSSRLITGIPELTDTKLQKMSSNIEHIVNDDPNAANREEYVDEYIKYRDQLLTRILGYNVVYDNPITVDGTTIPYDLFINNIKKATYQYFQFTMFKRAMFKCTNISYNQTNGRVNRMEFKVVLESDGDNGQKIKFD